MLFYILLEIIIIFNYMSRNLLALRAWSNIMLVSDILICWRLINEITKLNQKRNLQIDILTSSSKRLVFLFLNIQMILFNNNEFCMGFEHFSQKYFKLPK